MNHIAEYSRLNLTYESDILNGMQGIFRACQDLPVPVYNYLGIPIMWGTESKTPASLTAGFLQGLTWRLSKPSRRRTGFPSWPWTGWAGRVEWPSIDFSTDDSIALHVSSEENEQVRWENMQQQMIKNSLPVGLSSSTKKSSNPG